MNLEWGINGMIGMVGIRDDGNTNETFVFLKFILVRIWFVISSIGYKRNRKYIYDLTFNYITIYLSFFFLIVII